MYVCDYIIASNLRNWYEAEEQISDRPDVNTMLFYPLSLHIMDCHFTDLSIIGIQWTIDLLPRTQNEPIQWVSLHEGEGSTRGLSWREVLLITSTYTEMLPSSNMVYEAKDQLPKNHELYIPWGQGLQFHSFFLAVSQFTKKFLPFSHSQLFI